MLRLLTGPTSEAGSQTLPHNSLPVEGPDPGRSRGFLITQRILSKPKKNVAVVFVCLSPVFLRNAADALESLCATVLQGAHKFM